jgi:septal ring factor EnvC (AmiA/AmiB activator)
MKNVDATSIATANTMSDHIRAPLWFGYSIDFWGDLSFWLLIVAVCAGALTAVASGLSSYIGSEVTSRVQRSSEERIEASERATAEALEHAKALEVVMEEAKADVANVNARIAEAKTANKLLEIELEKERRERIRLQSHLTSRRITAEQRDVLVSVLRRRPGTVVIQSMLPPRSAP